MNNNLIAVADLERLKLLAGVCYQAVSFGTLWQLPGIHLRSCEIWFISTTAMNDIFYNSFTLFIDIHVKLTPFLQYFDKSSLLFIIRIPLQIYQFMRISITGSNESFSDRKFLSGYSFFLGYCYVLSVCETQTL